MNLKVNVKQKKKELGISKNIPILLSVGELNKNKNHETVLQALSKLKDQNFIYLICGRGVLKEYLERKKKKMMKRKVQM